MKKKHIITNHCEYSNFQLYLVLMDQTVLWGIILLTIHNHYEIGN